MAIIILGAVVSDIRGSIGGVTFSRSRTGAFIRSRVKGTVSSNQKLGLHQSYLTTFVDWWRNVFVQEDRDNWDAFAATVKLPNRLGFKYTPTGYSLFIRMNLTTTQFGGPAFQAVPRFLHTETPSFLLTWSAGDDQVKLISQPFTVPTQSGVIVYRFTDDRPVTQNYIRPPWVGQSTGGFDTGVTLNELLLPATPTRTPSQRTYAIRFINALDGPSPVSIRSIKIPA